MNEELNLLRKWLLLKTLDFFYVPLLTSLRGSFDALILLTGARIGISTELISLIIKVEDDEAQNRWFRHLNFYKK